MNTSPEALQIDAILTSPSLQNPNYTEELGQLEKELEALKKKILQVRKSMPQREVENYLLTHASGSPVTLADLFGDKTEMILVHNMGKGCRHCTLWADGFTGLTKHLENRVAFILSSPDKPETLRQFARDRDWTFECVSTFGTTLKKDLGFEMKPKDYWPGFTVLRKDASGKIYETAKDIFGPGDYYSPIYHFFDLLPSTTEEEWEPKYYYEKV